MRLSLVCLCAAVRKLLWTCIFSCSLLWFWESSLLRVGLLHISSAWGTTVIWNPEQKKTTTPLLYKAPSSAVLPAHYLRLRSAGQAGEGCSSTDATVHEQSCRPLTVMLLRASAGHSVRSAAAPPRTRRTLEYTNIHRCWAAEQDYKTVYAQRQNFPERRKTHTRK